MVVNPGLLGFPSDEKEEDIEERERLSSKAYVPFGGKMIMDISFLGRPSRNNSEDVKATGNTKVATRVTRYSNSFMAMLDFICKTFYSNNVSPFL